jgi:hypothetical protein
MRCWKKIIILVFKERMTYLRDESKIVYQSKDAKQTKTFNALEWLAAMCSHAPIFAVCRNPSHRKSAYVGSE